MSLNKIICGDCLNILPTLPQAQCIIADPPDNLGMKYNGYCDRLPGGVYFQWLGRVISAALSHTTKAFWLSYYHTYQGCVWHYTSAMSEYCEARQFIWRYTFGQHRHTDCGNGYRPIMRLSKIGQKWHTDAIRVESQRQRNGDKRADPRGRVPDDVWEFPRVCGTYDERRKWAVTQHPDALIDRMVRMSCWPGDLVIDMFAHSGTVNRVCKRIGIDCIGIDISPFYCEKIAEETGAELVMAEELIA